MANVTSSIIPEVHNISQRRQRRTEPWPQATCAENLVEFRHLTTPRLVTCIRSRPARSMWSWYSTYYLNLSTWPRWSQDEPADQTPRSQLISFVSYCPDIAACVLWTDCSIWTTQNTQPFNGPLSWTTREGRYQKKHHPPAHIPTIKHPSQKLSVKIWFHITKIFRGESRGWLGWLVTPPGTAAYFMLLLRVWLKLFRCRYVPLLEPNPSPISPDPLNARSLRSLGFPKSPGPL